MNTTIARISVTGIAAVTLGITALFGAAGASAATPEGPGIAAAPCLIEFCPPAPDPDPEPDPDPKPAFPGPGTLSVCLQLDDNGQPDCDEEVEPESKFDTADGFMICTPWLHSLGICGNDGGDPPGQASDELVPAPHCVQIHKEFPCPDNDEDEPEDGKKDVPEILPFDGECHLILVEIGETPPIDPDCEDGLCVHQPHEKGQVPEFVDPDCDVDEDTGDEDIPQDPPAGEPEGEGDGVDEQPLDEGDDEPQGEPGDEPAGESGDEPADEPSDEPADDEPADVPQDEPTDGGSQDQDVPDQVIPGAPDAGTGNAVGGMSPNSIYAALGLAIAGGILGGAALSLGRKS